VLILDEITRYNTWATPLPISSNEGSKTDLGILAHKKINFWCSVWTIGLYLSYATAYCSGLWCSSGI